MPRYDVISEIAGKVWKIDAPVGSDVDEEDPIVILESMKMEIPVPSPAAGKVVEIKVAEGDPVDEDQVVAIVEA